jgi:hypothetical protein
MESIHVGQDIDIWTEPHVFEGWHEVKEWLDVINPYDIHTIQVFNGPGSLVSLIVTFAKYVPYETEPPTPKAQG